MNENGILFKDETHKKYYYHFIMRFGMEHIDPYKQTAAYLLALDIVRDHFTDIFDFSESAIKPDGISAGWQTGTSTKTTRLLFNLWNGYCYNEQDEPTADYTPDNIFCCELASYFIQAIKIRYPEYTAD